MKITTINEFKKYLAEAHMDFGNETTGGNADTQSLLNQIKELDIYIHENSVDGKVIAKFNAAIEEYIGTYNPAKQDGVPLEQTIAEANLSVEQLKSLVEELTNIKKSMGLENNDVQPEQYHIGSIDVYVDGEFFRSGDNEFTYEPNDPNLKSITSSNPEDFKEYLNPEAIKQYFSNTDTTSENPLMKYGTEEELKNILFDVKMWFAPDQGAPFDNDNAHFEPAEGTNQGEEGYYWALKLNYINNEHGVYTFADKNYPNSDFSIDIDGADLATDVRESEVQNQDSFKPQAKLPGQYEDFPIDKVISYLGEEFGLKDSAHEGDIKVAMADLGIKHEDYFTIKQDLEDKGWIIEPEK